MGLIVDTSVLIELERKSKRLSGLALGTFLFRTGEVESGASALTLTELVFGHASNTALTEEAKTNAVADLRAVLPVYAVTEEIAPRAGQLNALLRQNGTATGLADVLIAATALKLGFGILTHNVRHFSYVPGLQVVDAAAV